MPETSDLHRDMGRLEGRMEAVERELREMKGVQGAIGQDLKAIRSTIDQATGGWKTILLVAAAGGAVGALLMKLSWVAGVLPK